MTSRSLCTRNNQVSLEFVNRQEIHAWQLEDTIKSYLQEDPTDNHQSNKDDEEEFEDVCQIHVRPDAHWLRCRHPAVAESTIMGIWEEEYTGNDPDENPPVRLSLYTTASSNAENAVKPPCACVPPHSEWNQKSLPMGGDQSASPIQVDWIDIRQWQQKQASFLETPSAVCHFLRSMLGSSHVASPWVAEAPSKHCDEEENKPDVVALVLSSSVPPKMLAEFRHGNACPSYFLHSTSKLYLPSSTTWITSETSDSFTFGNLAEANLLVFRRLPPRDHLSPFFPIMASATQQDSQPSLPDGCLWEAFFPVNDEQNKNDDNVLGQPHFRALSPPFISTKLEYAGLIEPLLAPTNFNVIRNEAISIPQWTAWPEKQHYSSTSSNNEGKEGESWTVFPLCHCFPANLVENRKWIQSTCAFCPQTTALLQKHLGDTLRTALFSRLKPETTLEPHTGWEDLANHVFRLHLPLVVPNQDEGLCGAWVDGCVETHAEGRPMCFDDSKTHRAFNYSPTQERVVLILDLARPAHLPLGMATGGHTDELDKFIEHLT